MATRFVTTYECDASEKFKQTYIDSKQEDMVIIKSPVGMPGRAIRNKFLDEVSHGKRKPFKCPYHCLKTCDYNNTPYCISFALINAQRGNLSHGFAFAGENAYRAEKITSVKEVIETLKKEYEECCSLINVPALLQLLLQFQQVFREHKQEPERKDQQKGDGQPCFSLPGEYNRQ